MAVQVWIGEKPENPNERRAIVALANGLDRLDGLYVLLANFNVGGRTIDLVILKQDAIFIIELKHCDGKLFGGVNGPWYIESTNGNRKRLNPGRKNPYNQVISYYYSFINFLNEHRGDFLSPHKAETINFRNCKRVIVIAPTFQDGSSVELDWKVEIRGLDEIPTFLVTERAADIELSDAEMLAIPELLRCTRWQEVNDLLVGVMPSWNSLPAAGLPEPVAVVPVVLPEPVVVTPPPSPTTGLPLQRLRAGLQTAAGRLALVASILVVVLLVILAVRPTREVFPRINLPAQSLVNATMGPAGGVLVGDESRGSECVWAEFQPVGKRWDASTQQWISVGVDGIVTSLSPEVVITLEQVSYCGERISLRWSVRNYSDTLIEFPLRDDNIAIRDPVGNVYAIANGRSRPALLRVEPDEIGYATAVVLRPVSYNAPSLLVRVIAQPFEASWLVSLD